MITLKSRTPKARKEHKCNYCLQPIPKGEVYGMHVNVHEGQRYTWKNHLQCQKIAQKLGMFEHCDDGVTDDDFFEFIIDEFEKLFPDEVKHWPEQVKAVIGHHLKPKPEDTP